jgi:hypothetical protein
MRYNTDKMVGFIRKAERRNALPRLKTKDCEQGGIILFFEDDSGREHNVSLPNSVPIEEVIKMFVDHLIF